MATTPIVVDVINYTDTFKIWADKCNGLITAVNATNFVVEEDPVMFLDASRDVGGTQTVTGIKTFNNDQIFNYLVTANGKVDITGTSQTWGDGVPGTIGSDPDAGLEVTGTTRIWDQISFSQETEYSGLDSNQTIGFIPGSERFTVLAASSSFQTPKLINGEFIELNEFHYQLPGEEYGNTTITRYGENNDDALAGAGTYDGDGSGVYYLKNIGTQGTLNVDPEGVIAFTGLTSNNLIWQKDLSGIDFNDDEHNLRYYGPDGEKKYDLQIPDYGSYVVNSLASAPIVGPGSSTLTEITIPNRFENIYEFKHTNSGKDGTDIVQQATYLTDWTNFENVPGDNVANGLKLTTFSGYEITIDDLSDLTVVDAAGDKSLRLTSFTGEYHDVADLTDLDNTTTPGTITVTSFTGETHDITTLADITAPTPGTLRLTDFAGDTHDLLTAADLTAPSAGTLRLTDFTGDTHDYTDQTAVSRTDLTVDLTSVTGAADSFTLPEPAPLWFLPINYTTASNANISIDSEQFLNVDISTTLAVGVDHIITGTTDVIPNIPAGCKAIQVTVKVNGNTRENNHLDFDIRKNNTESYTTKIHIDPNGTNANPTEFEGEEYSTFVVYFDTSTNTFDWRLTNVYNNTPSVNPDYYVDILLDGYYIETPEGLALSTII